MSTSLSTLLDTLNSAPESITFDAVQAVIAEHYHYTPASFINGCLLYTSDAADE